MRVSNYYGDNIESITVTHEGSTAEFIHSGTDHIGIRLDGVLRYFRIRGISKNRIYVTGTGISACDGAVWSFVEHHSDDDAMWLARAAFGSTKPIRRHVFAEWFLVKHPELVA